MKETFNINGTHKNIGAYGTYDGKQKAPSQMGAVVKEDSKLQRAETVSVLVGTPYTERA